MSNPDETEPTGPDEVELAGVEQRPEVAAQAEDVDADELAGDPVLDPTVAGEDQ